MSDDYAASTETTGRVAVGGTAAGVVEVWGDRDWYAVELRAGWVYSVEVRGFWTGDGTLGNPHLYGIHDAGGDVIAGTQDADSGVQWNSRLKFTAPSDGTYYVAAGAGSGRGTYEVGVTRLVGEQTGVDAGSTRASAGDLGDLTEQALGGAKFPRGTLDGVGDRVDYYRFELTEARDIEFGLRRQETNADLYLEDAEGRVLASSAVSGTTNESLVARLGAGTYYVRVEAREVGASEYVLRYGSTSAQREPGSTRESAMELGDITGLEEVVRHRDQVGVHGDDIDYYRFELTEARSVRLGLTAQDADADLYVEDEAGHVLGSATASGTGDEALTQTLLAGTYFVRVQAQESGRNVHEFSYAVGDADAAEVAQLLAAETPAFGESGYAFDLAENADGSTNRIVLGTVAATDPDGDTVSYSLAGGNESGLFTIDTSSGEVFYVGSGEGYEGGAGPYALTVRASDGTHTVDTTVTVTVADVAEAPAFGESSYAFALAENADGSTNRIVLGTVTATDPDGDAVSYSLAGGNESELFTIDASSGEVFYVGSGEGYESGAGPYALTVRASDGTHTVDTTVTVTVADVAEAPAFGESSYAFALAENADGSTNRIVLGTVAATDEDGGTVSYSLAGGNESGLFTVDASSGEVFYVGSGEDYESGADPFALTVRASDEEHSTDTTVTVTVADVAESSGVSEPAGGDLARGRTTTGVVVVDGGPVTGNIESVLDRDWFAVELRAGQRYVVEQRGRSTDDGTLIDPYLFGLYDASGRRIPDTTADDGGVGINSRLMFTAPRDGTYYIAAAGNGQEFSGRGTYEVEVRVVPDAPVFGESGYAFALAEHADGSTNRIVLGTVAATDLGGDTVSYSLAGGNESGLFMIDASSGEVFYVGSGEDYEGNADPYALTVRASDGEHTTDTTVTVTVADVAEAPAFGESDYAFDLAEHADGSTNRIVLGTVAATDDEGDTVSYSLAGGNESGLFTIDASSGEVFYVGSGEGYESGADPYALTVRASDGERSTDTTVTVAVTDLARDRTTTGAVVVDRGPVTGGIDYSGDVDWFAVTLEAGRTYRIDLEGWWTGAGSLWDPYLRGVHAANGTLIDRTWNDEDGTGHNSRVMFTARENATYYVAAGAYRDREGTYTLSVTDFTDDFAATTATRGAVSVGGSATSDIDSRGDVDWFAVTLEAGKTYRIDLEGSRTDAGSLNNPLLHGVHDADGTFIPGTRNDNGGTGRYSQLVFTAGETATYYVAAGVLDGGIPVPGYYTGTYKLSVTEVVSVGDDFTATTATTGRVLVGGSATGDIKPVYYSLNYIPADVDWFAVTLEAGKLYRIDLEGWWTGAGSLVLPDLRGIHDADGTRLSNTSYSSPNSQISQMYFNATETATYYVAASAREQNYANIYYGSEGGTYKLSVTQITGNRDTDIAATTATTGAVSVGGSATREVHYADDVDWFAVTLEAGRTYRIDLEGWWTRVGSLSDPYLRGVHDSAGALIDSTTNDNGGAGRNSRLTFTAGESATYYVAAGADGSGGGTYMLSVADVTDSAPDVAATTATSGAVSVGGSVMGELETRGDVDWFAVTLEAGKTYRIDLKGSPTGADSLTDPYLRGVHDSAGTLIAGTTNDYRGSGWNNRLYFTAEESATYYVAAGTYVHLKGTYRLSVTEVTDDFAVTTATRGEVLVGGSATGEIHSAGDADWFAVTLEAGRTYRIDLEGSSSRADSSLSDPYLRGVHDATGALIDGTTNDDGSSYNNSWVMFTAGESATYYVAAGADGGEQGTYKVSVTALTDDFAAATATTGEVSVGGWATGEIDYRGDVDWFAVTLEAGRTYRIDLEGRWSHVGTLADPYLRGVHDAAGTFIAGTMSDNGGRVAVGGEDRNSRLYFTADESVTYYVAAGASSVRDEGTYRLSVRDVTGGVTDDFAATTATRGEASVGGSATGDIETSGDVDWFAVTLEADTTYRIDLEGWGTRDGTLYDPYLRGVHDADGTLIDGTTNDDGGTGRNSRLTFAAKESATYYVAAGDYGFLGGTYTLSVEEVTDGL